MTQRCEIDDPEGVR